MARAQQKLIITRWERVRAPDGWAAQTMESADITTRQPPRGQGWSRCVIDMSTRHALGYVNLVYLSREAW
jgi:hypothetical protein